MRLSNTVNVRRTYKVSSRTDRFWYLKFPSRITFRVSNLIGAQFLLGLHSTLLPLHHILAHAIIHNFFFLWTTSENTFLLYTANTELSYHSKCADNKQCYRNETQLSVICVALSTCLNCALASFWQHRYHKGFQMDKRDENGFKQGYPFVLHYQAKLNNS